MQRKRPRPVEGPADIGLHLLDPMLAAGEDRTTPVSPIRTAPDDWQPTIARLQDDGLLTPVQAGDMGRFFSERHAIISERMPLIESEFLQRRDRDGIESATDWLRDTKRQLQHDQLEATRRMLESMGIPEEALRGGDDRAR